jgi:hypothetical protein
MLLAVYGGRSGGVGAIIHIGLVFSAGYDDTKKEDGEIMADQILNPDSLKTASAPARTPRRLPDRPWFKRSAPLNARRPKAVQVPPKIN